jgi:DNA polymerase III delta prime subunit
MNNILDRENIENQIKQILFDFDDNCRCNSFKKGIYIYGSPGSGKTSFITNLLKDLDYDMIKYDAGDVRNKSLIDTITCNNISNRNVLHMMNRKVKKIVIVMDEIDGMNNGDKGGITSLIKLIRQKKTKKQKKESVTLNPIICIGNYFVDKKIKELMKVCNVFELKTVTNTQIEKLLDCKEHTNLILYPNIVDYIQGDLRKLFFIKNIITTKPELLKNPYVLENIFLLKSHNIDAKKITKIILSQNIPLQDHIRFMNETERTIVALLYHENLIDPLFSSLSIQNKDKYLFYSKVLDNVCFADYIDRITFQNQIWIFNEMSSLIKTFSNNHLYHNKFPELKLCQDDIRFTKVLTKYSTEYNNQIFIYNLCQQLDMDKKDMISFFQELRLFHGKNFYNNNELIPKIDKIFEETNITRLDIKRMYRYLDKNQKINDVVNDEDSDNDNDN